MADVPEVAVAAVAVAVVERKYDAMLLTEFDLILTGLHFPYISHTPRSDDLQIRGESLDAELKTDLVISFTGRAVADRGSTFLAGDLYETLCNGRTGHRGAEQIAVLIDSACLYARHNEIIAELILDVFNV